MKALEVIGNHEWEEQVARLSSYQFDALWFGNPAAVEAVFMKYGAMTDQATEEDGSSKERWQNRRIDAEAEEFSRFLDWAENTVPRNRPQDGIPQTGNGKKTSRRR